MARLDKAQLLRLVERAVLESGWSYLCLSAAGQHPAHYSVFHGETNQLVCVYIWNLTSGGRGRPADEWRVQATGIDGFQSERDVETLILGWEQERQVFVGFDLRKHQGPLGHSPSIQLRERALDDAAVNGFAIHNKGNDELAVAFRPGFLATYIVNQASLHECGEVEREIELLKQIGRGYREMDDEQVGAVVGTPRQYAVVATKRALRAIDFRDRVLTAYGHSCAMCSVQLRLLDAAHILPAAHDASTDGTDNGVALCALHHRAFDSALVTFDIGFRTHVNDVRASRLKAEGKDGGLAEFRNALRPILALPPDRRDRPAERFVDMANRLRGWTPD